MRVRQNQTREVTVIAVGGEAEGGGRSVWKGRQEPKSGRPVCQESVNIFCKEPDGKFLGFADHMVSVATSPPW